MKTLANHHRFAFPCLPHLTSVATLTAALAMPAFCPARAADQPEHSFPGYGSAKAESRITSRDFAMTYDGPKSELVLRYKGRPLLVYAYATNQFKPYVRELYTLRGENVLLDAPSDHLHHHGLMYAIRVNGVNFWEEKTDPGVEKSVGILPRIGMGNGIETACFSQLIHWVANTNHSVADWASVAMLVERRTLTVSVNEAQQEVAVEWLSEFEVGAVAGGIQLHGAEYNGLGFRPVRAFDKVAEFQDSRGASFTNSQPKTMPAAQWTSMSAQLDGKPVCVAMFGGPENARGQAVFFTMREPFAYLAATQALNKEPIFHSPGNRFRLRYLVTVSSESRTPAQLEERYGAWVSNIRNKLDFCPCRDSGPPNPPLSTSTR